VLIALLTQSYDLINYETMDDFYEFMDDFYEFMDDFYEFDP